MHFIVKCSSLATLRFMAVSPLLGRKKRREKLEGDKGGGEDERAETSVDGSELLQT